MWEKSYGRKKNDDQQKSDVKKESCKKSCEKWSLKNTSKKSYKNKWIMWQKIYENKLIK